MRTSPSPHLQLSPSRAGLLVGSLFGVANGDAPPGEPVVISTRGVYDLPKEATDAIAVGDEVFWDDANDVVTVKETGAFIGHTLAAACNPCARSAGSMTPERQIERAKACLRRLAVLSDCDPGYLPLFDWWSGEASRIKAEAEAEQSRRERAADLAWQTRLKSDQELAEMLA